MNNQMPDFTTTTNATMQIHNEAHPCPIVKTFTGKSLKEVFTETHAILGELAKVLPLCTFSATLEFTTFQGNAVYNLSDAGNIYNADWKILGNVREIPENLYFYYGTGIVRDGEHEYLERGVCCANDMEHAERLFFDRWKPFINDYRILKDVGIRQITEKEYDILSTYI